MRKAPVRTVKQFRTHLKNRILPAIVALALCGATAHGEDWPEWRGRGRLGLWRETGIVDSFAPGGLEFKWRTPLKGGYSGPSVAGGRVFVTDFERTRGQRGIERAVALDAETGKVLWTREWPVDYAALNRNVGPRATPTVDGERVYVLGAMGALLCLDVADGRVIWRKDYVADYQSTVPMWGMVGAPLVDGERLICLVGGRPGAKAVAFDKITGEEIWRALDSDSEPGYAPPVIFSPGGRRQLIVWHPKAVASLDPRTGEVGWQAPFDVRSGLTVATPVLAGERLLVSSFYNGSMLLALGGGAPKVLWQGRSDSEIRTDGLHALNSTPQVVGDYIYGVCSYGQLRCLELATGKRVWETFEATTYSRWATAFLVRNGERFFINNDMGDLIIARLTPAGYHEISRTKLLEPTTAEQRRGTARGRVNWSHPAYALRHIFARNDKEIVCASLEKK